MRFEVYCDEAHPDVLTSAKPRMRYLMIGSLWLPADLREQIKIKVRELRQTHKTWGEIKWSKVSPSRQAFYIALADLFTEFGKDLRFRCIAVDRTQLNQALYEDDSELGFYKFYYQLLHHWILDYNVYRIFCDTKSNRDPKRLSVLARCLSYSNLTSKIENIQSLPSGQVVPIQLCDLLLGAASSRMNQTLTDGTAKTDLVRHLEAALGHRLEPTPKNEEKFNIFRIRLQGGW